MIDTVFFCNDGVLRLEPAYETDEMLLPITLMEKKHNETKINPFYLLRYFHKSIKIEEGTTLSHVMLALEPWEELISNYTGIDFKSYLDEIKKPSEVSTGGLKDAWINFYRTSMYQSDLDHSDTKGLKFSERLNRPKKYTDKFTKNERLEASLFYNNENGEEKRYAFSDIQEMKNLPIFANVKHIVHSFYKGANMFGAFDNVTKFDPMYGGSGMVIQDDLTLEEFINALFRSGFDYRTPDYKREVDEKLKVRVEAIEKMIASEEKEESQENKDDHTYKSDNSNPAPHKIVIAPGFGSDFIEIIQQNEEDWARYKKDCLKISDGKPPVRIGEVKESKAPEVFIYNMDLS